MSSFEATERLIRELKARAEQAEAEVARLREERLAFATESEERQAEIARLNKVVDTLKEDNARLRKRGLPLQGSAALAGEEKK